MTSADIRQSFLDFFKSKEHVVVASSPLVIPTDPTLLFANAGMNQFKEIFLGARESAHRRVVNTQKCIRVSGKHNDLEEVGLDTYHHTFFEMLGNWSFGDYYKSEAIAWGWELLTEVWGLPKDRLWATVFREDEEAETLWKAITDINPKHVLRFDEKDNFWEMGETGPCGPCSEIHIDLTPDGCSADMINAGLPDVIELWNLVFIQHNRRSDGVLEDLPSKHVDTGLGFERLVAVLNGKPSNYDTDLFQPLLDHLQELSGLAYEGEHAVAMRVIADHVRTLSFAIGDGVMPSNEGRGYVLRRILRRAVRYGRKLGLEEPFMASLFPALEGVMGRVFPEIVDRRSDVLRALQAEEESFAMTLDRGIHLFESVVSQVRGNEDSTFPGEEAFKLYDTYGFPVDLTTLMAAENDLAVDQQKFDELMEEQRERARAARKSEVLAEEMELVSDLVKRGIRSEFKGYETLEHETNLLFLLAKGQAVEVLEEGAEGALILAETPFYSEAGGQLGDHGMIRGPSGEFEVWDTQRPAEGMVLHVGRVVQGQLSRDDVVAAIVDGKRRELLERHHSATHLLNCALREFVSASVRQAGSLVAPDRLRFDFTHHEAIPTAKLEAIERRVNQWIMDDEAVTTSEMAFKDVPDSGIIAVFDEKYGDVVRVVDIGGYSRELCGGTHVRETGQLGFFRIVSESSVASGIRRIEAVCGWPAYEWTRREHELVQHFSHRFSVPQEELRDRIEGLVDQNKKLEKQLRAHASQTALGQVDQLLESVSKVGDVDLLAAVVENQGMDGLRKILDGLRPRLASGVIVLGSAAGGKASFVASVSKDLVARGLHAGQLLGKVARVAGGGGGGQPHKAQAGGKDASKVPAAIEEVAAFLTEAVEETA